jgi:hypothetical protein
VRSVLDSMGQASMIRRACAKRDEPVLVQTLVAELAVEALDAGVLVRLAWPDERQLHGPLVRPRIEYLAFELRAMSRFLHRRL